MKALELKMPPPLVAFIMLVLAWWCRGVLPVATAGVWLDVLAALVLLQGVIIAMAGVYEFVRVDTTVHPFHPEHTEHVVTHGVYAFSRNPMYLGMLLCLAAVAVLHWRQPLNVVWCIGFYAYINRFQIRPEERILSQKFGEPFKQYCLQVHRWLGHRAAR